MRASSAPRRSWRRSDAASPPSSRKRLGTPSDGPPPRSARCASLAERHDAQATLDRLAAERTSRAGATASTTAELARAAAAVEPPRDEVAATTARRDAAVERLPRPIAARSRSYQRARRPSGAHRARRPPRRPARILGLALPARRGRCAGGHLARDRGGDRRRPGPGPGVGWTAATGRTRRGGGGRRAAGGDGRARRR